MPGPHAVKSENGFFPCDTWLQIFQNDSKICEAEVTVTPLINKICNPCKTAIWPPAYCELLIIKDGLLCPCEKKPLTFYLNPTCFIPTPQFEFPFGSSLTELSDFCPSTESGNERECKQTFEKHAPKVTASLLLSSPPIRISHQLFRCKYSNSRDIVAGSPSFSCPARQSAPESLLAG